MTHTTIEDCPELNMRNFTDVDVERLNNWAIEADAEIERLTTERDAYKLDARRYRKIWSTLNNQLAGNSLQPATAKEAK